ncbi:hypothetical protein AX16_002180 [Volvariella volvacea WC 439]|nr:hypothetical protein AX16_002180 [Volvariella volvacea WC 439]
MDSPFQSALIGIVLICTSLIASKALWKKNLTPGPRGLPLIGNVLDIPKEQPWLTFAEWAKKYGDVIYLSLLGKPMLIIDSFPTAIDLLEKRGSIYSDRPFLQMIELVGLSRGMAIQPYNDRLKAYRRFFAKAMGNTTALRKYNQIEEEEGQRFARKLLSEPESFMTHAEYFAAAVIMRAAYGYQVKEYNDYFVELVQSEMKGFSEIAVPGRFLVELIPPLKYIPDWFPGTGWKEFMRRQTEISRKTVNETFNWTRSQMEIGHVDCFVSNSLEELEELGDEAIDRLKWSASSMYAGGGDTTVASIQSFFFAMAKYPQVQARAQTEIDQIVGTDRLPSIEDWDNLPYTRALVWEVLRWHSLAPTGLPHVSTEEDIYNGYFIPKGTMVIANIWAMTHDPDVYHNPDEFNPARYLKTKESDIPERDPQSAQVSFLAPTLYLALPNTTLLVETGRLLVEASIYISCATILATFNITKNTNADLKYEVQSSTISHLKPFKCNIKPRSAKAVELIKKPLPSEDQS